MKYYEFMNDILKEGEISVAVISTSGHRVSFWVSFKVIVKHIPYDSEELRACQAPSA